MNCLEEQAMELEALESIFMQDFTRVSDSCCKIIVQPFSEDNANEVSHVAAECTFTYPSEYPTVIPNIAIDIIKGFAASQKDTLFDIAISTAKENIGSAMLYNIVEALKLWMIDNNFKPLTEHELIVKRKLERSEMKVSENYIDGSDEEEYDHVTDAFESHAVQQGNMVTIENFSKWKKEFDRIIKEKWRIEDEQSMDSEAAKRMTGKKYFELNSSSGGFLDAIELEFGNQQNVVGSSFYQDEVPLDEKANSL